MKKICFVTGTRADYGIMAPIMLKIAQNPQYDLQIVATNMHMSPDYGFTVSEIEGDGFKVDYKISSLVPGGSAAATVKSMAKAQEGLAEAFEALKPDLVVILGDRYEALAAAAAAVVFNIPVAHLHGGEITEGAIDNYFRDAITKLSTFHFASTPQYADRITSMGVPVDRVFHSGAPGAEIIEGEPEDKTYKEFFNLTGLYPTEPYVMLAMHPATLLHDNGLEELKTTLKAVETFINQGYKILATMPNSDPGTKEFIQTLHEWASKHPGQVIEVKSLGSRLFHHAMETAAVMVGNSSAALIEAPSHRLPSVNIGCRQKGRAHGLTVIDAPADKGRIEKAISAALSLEMKAVLLGMSVASLNPYYKKDAADFIAKKLMETKN